MDLQNAAVIVFDGIHAAVEMAAIDDQLRVGRFICTIVETAGDHAGEVACLHDGNTGIDGHFSKILNVIVGVAARVHLIAAVLLAAGIGAAIQNHSTTHIVEDSSLAVADVIHRAGAIDGQRTVIGDGMTGHIGQFAARCEFEDNILASGDRQILADITLQGDARFNTSFRRIDLILQRTGQRCESILFFLREQGNPRVLQRLC